MPIRIYALAKELKIDSKALVDVCTKAGVTGKGSALASLSDDEAEKVKSYLAGGTKKGTGGESRKSSPKSPVSSDDRAITRDDYIGPGGSSGTPRNLDAKPETKPAEETKPEERPKAPVKR